MALTGLALYAISAPHSIAAAAIAAGFAGLGWLVRSAGRGSFGLRRSKFDMPILLLLLWTIASSLLSTEPRISLTKLQALWCVFLFYLVRAVVQKRAAFVLVALLILSASAGSLYSIYDLARGRGVVIQGLSSDSPLQRINLQVNDAIWRVGGRRVYSAREVDDALRSAPANKPLAVSVISQGEHAERDSLILSPAEQLRASPSGIQGTNRSHRFRASGWTRHYETFAELLQMIAQVALGVALANFRNHGPNKYFRLAIAVAALLTLGIALTAMRTVVVAFVVGASVMAWRSLSGRAKVAFTFTLFFVLAFAAVIIWETRAQHALALSDPSSLLRIQVARVGLSRIPLHPLFGHGMDAMKKHWSEWGFPGSDMVHLHSTPLQLTFDRGLPALLIWLWLMGAFWLHIAWAETLSRDMSDTLSYGILLGLLGALTGFLVSSLVNYNFGDAEVAMMFWVLMGMAMVVSDTILEPHTDEYSQL
jgi:O-Antigen ligase